MKDHEIKLRVTFTEKQRLQDMAREHRCSVADLIRFSTLGRTSKMPSRDLLMEGLRQLSGIATNINQVTKALHEERLAHPDRFPLKRFAAANAAFKHYAAAADPIRKTLRKGLHLS